MAVAQDEVVLEAVSGIMERLGDKIDVILVGDRKEIEAVIDSHHLNPVLKEKIDDVSNEEKAVKRAIEYVRRGEAQILLKGNLTTNELMAAVINKETGLRQEGRVISHFRDVERPDGILSIGDGGIIPRPSLKVKGMILDNMVEVAQARGVAMPLAVLLGYTGKVKQEVPSRDDSNILAGQCRDMPDREVVGPLGLMDALRTNPHILLVPDLSFGNILYKAIVSHIPWNLEYTQTEGSDEQGYLHVFTKLEKGTKDVIGHLIIASPGITAALQEEREDALERAITKAHNMGLSKPRAAFVDFTEKTQADEFSDIASLQQAAAIVEACRGRDDCIVEGPMDYYSAIVEGAAAKKGIASEMAGQPDILFAPTMETAEILRDLYTHWDELKLPWSKAGDSSYGARGNAVIGVPSRADSAEHKLNSLVVSVFTIATSQARAADSEAAKADQPEPDKPQAQPDPRLSQSGA